MLIRSPRAASEARSRAGGLLAEPARYRGRLLPVRSVVLKSRLDVIQAAGGVEDLATGACQAGEHTTSCFQAASSREKR